MVRYLDATGATYSIGVAPRGSGLGSLGSLSQQATFLFSHLCFLAVDSIIVLFIPHL